MSSLLPYQRVTSILTLISVSFKPSVVSLARANLYTNRNEITVAMFFLYDIGQAPRITRRFVGCGCMVWKLEAGGSAQQRFELWLRTEKRQRAIQQSEMRGCLHSGIKGKK